MSYESDARERKARRLGSLFFDHARDAIFKMDNLNGVKPRSAKDAAASVIIMANEAKANVWNEIAEAHGIRTPSHETVRLARKYTIARCTLLIQGPPDPFANFPSNN